MSVKECTCVCVCCVFNKEGSREWMGECVRGGDGLALIKQQKADLEGSIRFGVFDQQ